MSGAMDDFLSEDEKKYFESGGANEGEIKYEESVGDESESEDSSREPEASTESVRTDGERDDGAEEASTYEDDADSENEGSDNDEKSSKRNYEKAYKSELHKRKELKAALDSQAKRTAEIETALKALYDQHNQAAQQQQAPKEEIPDPEIDPIGYQQYKVTQLEKYVGEQNKYLQSQHQAQQAQAQRQAFMESYKSQAMQFAQKSQDFPDAYKFLTQAKMGDFIAAGFSPEQADAMLIEDELGIVAKAYQDKVNPAERIYKLAKARGYATGKATSNKPSVKDLSNIEKGIKASHSLKDGGGDAVSPELSIDNIDNMTFPEFDEFWSKLKKQQKGR